MPPNDDEIEALIDILLVEPSPGDTRLLEEEFKEAKILNTIYSVSNGETAIEFLHQRGEHSNKPRPDLILLNPQLPGKSGIDVLSEMENEPAISDIPVIVVTSSDVEESIVRDHGLEADAYFQKPVEHEDFVQFVREVEDFWLALIRNVS